jgi:hypothetical protein
VLKKRSIKSILRLNLCFVEKEFAINCGLIAQKLELHYNLQEIMLFYFLCDVLYNKLSKLTNKQESTIIKINQKNQFNFFRSNLMSTAMSHFNHFHKPCLKTFQIFNLQQLWARMNK